MKKEISHSKLFFLHIALLFFAAIGGAFFYAYGSRADIKIPEAPQFVDESIEEKRAPQRPKGENGSQNTAEENRQNEISAVEEAQETEDTGAEEAAVDKPIPEDPDDDMLAPGEGAALYISPEFSEEFTRCLSIYHKADVEKARECMVDYLVSNPIGAELAEANLMLGVILFVQQNYRAARGFLKTAEAVLSEGNDYALYFLARTNEATGDFKAAREAWERLSSEYPLSRFAVKAGFRTAIAVYNEGDIDGAALMLERLIEKNPKAPLTPEVVYTLFKIAVEKKDYGVAATKYHELLVNYSDSRASLDIVKDVAKLSKEGVKIKPLSYWQTYRRIRNLHKKWMRRTAQVEAISLERQLSASGKFTELHSRLLLFMGERLFSKRTGRPYLEQVVKMEGAPISNKAKASLLLARNTAWRNDNKAAIAAFQKIASAYQGTSAAGEALYFAAWYTANSGERAGAVELFDKFLKDYRGNEKYPEALWFGGWNNYRQGKYAEAARYFARLGDGFMPNDIGQQGRYWEGRALEKLGKQSEATEAYRKTVRDYYMWFYTFQAEERLSKLNALEGYKAVFEPATAAALSIKNGEEIELPKKAAFHLANAALLLKMGFVNTGRSEIGKIGDLPAGANAQKVIRLAKIYADQSDFHDAFNIVRDRFMATYLSTPLKPEFSRHPEAWKFSYPKAYAEVMDVYSQKHKLPLYFPYAIMREESHFRPEAVSAVGARGLMQIMPATGRQIADRLKVQFKVDMLFSPETNIDFGCWYLAAMLDKFGNNPVLAAAAYNAGPGAVQRWLNQFGELATDEFIEEITFRETRNYVKKVMKSLMVYKRLYIGEDTRLPYDQTVNVVVKNNVNF